MCSFKPRSLWQFATAAMGNQYSSSLKPCLEPKISSSKETNLCVFNGEKNDNSCQHFTQLYIYFFTEMLMVHLPTVLHLKGCIWDSVLHLIYLVSLLSLIFSLFYYHGMLICH